MPLCPTSVYRVHVADRVFSASRVRAYPRILAMVFLVASGLWLLCGHHLLDPAGNPVGNDFLTFWSASKLSVDGKPADAYHLDLIAAAEQFVIPASRKVFPWYYPIPYYLLIQPLAKLPYLVSLGLFEGLTLAFFLWVYARISRGTSQMWCLAGYSGLWINLLSGQNVFLIAALTGTVFLLFEEQPTLAGIALGCLVIKPHLVLLVPVALITVGAWRVLASAVGTGLFLNLAAIWSLGADTFRSSIAGLRVAKHLLETGAIPWARMPSAFACARLLGLSACVAYTAQITVALASFAVVCWVWRRCRDFELRGSAAILCSLLVSPYLYDYDLVCLAIPLTWLCRVGLKHGWMRGERELYLAAWLSPLLLGPIAKYTSFQAGPVLLLLLVAMTLRRAHQHARQERVSIHTPTLRECGQGVAAEPLLPSVTAGVLGMAR